jgi:Fe-S-cluster containining protein
MSLSATDPPRLSRKEALWLGCQAKTCCYTAAVVPSGRDVWRIARALDAPPWSFLVYFRAPHPRPDAFLLTPDGPPFQLLLAKGRGRRTKQPRPCIFLMRTRRGHHRCGLGDLRPRVCQSFPVTLAGDLLCIQPHTGCTCRAWALPDVDLAEEAAVVAARQEEAAEYQAVVAHWNAWVRESGAEADFLDFCSFVLSAYDDLAARTEMSE